MKVFLVSFKKSPGGPECAVVVAESVENARAIAEGYRLKEMWVRRGFSLSEYTITDIEEVDLEWEHVPYIGNHCC